MIDSKTKVKVPLYQSEIYGWLYNSIKWSNFFDSNVFVKFITLGNNVKLTNSAVREVKPGQKVLQVGATFGNQIDKIAEKTGEKGKYDLMDVNHIQLERAKEKYKYIFSNMGFIHQDAATPIKGKYDVIICYMLLHEVPMVSKTKIINTLLNSIEDRGKVVFIDYHNPRYFHPLRYVVRMLNRLYQPFAEKLWDREIHSLAKNKTRFVWRKTTYFGRMYQKVVATKK